MRFLYCMQVPIQLKYNEMNTFLNSPFQVPSPTKRRCHHFLTIHQTVQHLLSFAVTQLGIFQITL